MTDFALNCSLDIGETLNQDEVEEVFGTDFGYQFKGITYRHPDEGKYVILLVNEGALYDDQLGTGNKFTYDGEGVPEKGDQTETIANEALIDAVRDPIPIYFFTSEDGIDEYEYRGLASVEDYEYVSDGRRMIYRFHMQQLGASSWEEYQREEREIEERSRTEPKLTEEDTDFIESRSRARSAAFTRKVKREYDYACAICGSRRFSPEGNPEVEAAHLYPKSENGADDIRNGLALCQFHHWTVDSGWVVFTDERKMLLNDRTGQEPPEEIEDLEGRTLNTPEDSGLASHPCFLKAHRELHGFD